MSFSHGSSFSYGNIIGLADIESTHKTGDRCLYAIDHHEETTRCHCGTKDWENPVDASGNDIDQTTILCAYCGADLDETLPGIKHGVRYYHSEDGNPTKEVAR